MPRVHVGLPLRLWARTARLCALATAAALLVWALLPGPSPAASAAAGLPLLLPPLPPLPRLQSLGSRATLLPRGFTRVPGIDPPATSVRNPSPVVPWGAPVGDSDAVAVLYHWERSSGAPGASAASAAVHAVLLRLHRVGTWAAGRWARLRPLSQAPSGLRDARGLRVGPTVYVVADGLHPATGRQRVAVLTLGHAGLVAALGGAGDAASDCAEVAAETQTWLEPPAGTDPAQRQKNWMPFAATGGRLLFVYSVDPHVVVECDVPGSGECLVVAASNSSALGAAVGSSGPLRGSTAGCPSTADEEAVTTCANWRTQQQQQQQQQRSGVAAPDVYWHFCYQFAARHPHRVAAVTRPFRFGDRDGAPRRLQYVSGLLLHGGSASVFYSADHSGAEVVTVQAAKWKGMTKVL
eukprot:m51a1_g1903 hypothetical protein (409) ;mRNA; f:780594-781820